jgi:hypothetical protein
VTIFNTCKPETEEGFDITILSPRDTGLPFVVFILQDIGIVADVRIEIASTHRVGRSDTLKVAIRPTIRLMNGELDAHELALLTRWVDLNRDTLIKYWGGDIEYTEDVLCVLKPITGPDRVLPGLDYQLQRVDNGEGVLQ